MLGMTIYTVAIIHWICMHFTNELFTKSVTIFGRRIEISILTWWLSKNDNKDQKGKKLPYVGLIIQIKYEYSIISDGSYTFLKKDFVSQ